VSTLIPFSYHDVAIVRWPVPLRSARQEHSAASIISKPVWGSEKETAMRKLMLAVAAVAIVATPALAQSGRYYGHEYRGYAADPAYTAYPAYPDYPARAAVVGAGVVTGTVVGLGFSEGWWGPTVAGTVFPTTAAGAAAVGGVAGIGTIALLDAAIQPCRGFQALLGLNKEACVNGEFVGYAPPPPPRRGYRYR
jgi:hypothetical protein